MYALAVGAGIHRGKVDGPSVNTSGNRRNTGVFMENLRHYTNEKRSRTACRVSVSAISHSDHVARRVRYRRERNPFRRPGDLARTRPIALRPDLAIGLPLSGNSA